MIWETLYVSHRDQQELRETKLLPPITQNSCLPCAKEIFGFSTVGGVAIIMEHFPQASTNFCIQFVSLDINVNIFLSLGKQIKSKRVAWNCQNSKEISPPIRSANQKRRHLGFTVPPATSTLGIFFLDLGTWSFPLEEVMYSHGLSHIWCAYCLIKKKCIPPPKQRLSFPEDTPEEWNAIARSGTLTLNN